MRAPQGSVARQVFGLQVLSVVVVVVLATALAVLDARDAQRNDAVTRTVDIAESVADSPAVLAALRSPDPSARLQPFAEQVRRDTGTDFVVVMSPDRIRYSHPNPAMIGKEFIGDVGDAPDGGVFSQEYTGTLGPSMRSVVPVVDRSGSVVALVAVGIKLDRISSAVTDRLLRIAAVAGLLLVIGGLGAFFVSRRLRRQTHGLGAAEITRMFEYYDAVLHSVREGLLLLDESGVVQLANDEAVRLLGLDAPATGVSVERLGLPPELVASLSAGSAGPDAIHLVGDRVLVVNQAPAVWEGRHLGSVVTFRDHTELQAVSGELDSVRGLAESLRSQTHEAANRLHTVVSLIELGRPDDAVEFVTGELRTAQALADRVQGLGSEPVLAALLLGKSASAAERGISLEIDPASHASGSPLSPPELVTVLGNLIDNAFDAVASSSSRRVMVRVVGSGSALDVDVDDSGPGIDDASAAHVFDRGWSTKRGDAGIGRGLGLALVAQTVRRHGGRVWVEDSALGGAALRVRVGS